MESTSVSVPTTAAVGVGPRALATIIDFIIIVAVMYAIGAITGESDGASVSLGTASTCVLSLAVIAYYIVMEKMFGGTVGKLVLGLQVVKEDGSPLDWGSAAIRTVLRIVDGLFVYLVAAILVWTSPTKQRLGDRVAKTLVVKKGVAAGSPTPSQQF
jgi:uncharacterized RDD family membrane protein YckC